MHYTTNHCTVAFNIEDSQGKIKYFPPKGIEYKVHEYLSECTLLFTAE